MRTDDLPKFAAQLATYPGFWAYDLDRAARLDLLGSLLDTPRSVLTRVSLCRSPRRDAQFTEDVSAVASATGASQASLAGLARRLDAVDVLRSAPVRSHAGAVLAAARDIDDETLTTSTGMPGLPHWVQQQVEQAGLGTATGQAWPRDLELPLMMALPIGIVDIDGLTLADIATWLSTRGVRLFDDSNDRRLHAAAFAYAGTALFFVDSSVDDQERRYSLAHETGHFLEYLLVRRRASRRNPELLEVLDGVRAPTTGERVDALLGSVDLGVTMHVVERTGDGDPVCASTGRAERRADLLAWQLLAPATLVRARAEGARDRDRLTAILVDEFGLPGAPASRYAAYMAVDPGPGGNVKNLFG